MNTFLRYKYLLRDYSARYGVDFDGRHVLVTIGNSKQNTGFESSISIIVDK